MDTHRLSAPQKESFETDGFLIIDGLLDAGEVATCRAEIQRLHELYNEMKAAGDAKISLFEIEPYSEIEEDAGGLPVLRKIESVESFSPVFEALPAHPKLVALMRSLIGPDFLLFRNTLMFKPARYGSAHGLHQDSAYWPMTPPNQVTVSIALNDATPQNGCFQVIPGSHMVDLEHSGTISRPDAADIAEGSPFDTSGLIEVSLSAGSAICFQSRLVHGSGPNTSSSPRNTALYAYFPPDVRYVPRDNDPAEKTFRGIAGCAGEQTVTFHAQN